MDASTLPPLPTTPPPQVSDPNSLAPLPPDRSYSPASSSSSSSSSPQASTEESQVLQTVAQEVLQSPKKDPQDIKDDQIIARLKAGEGGSVQLSPEDVRVVLERLTISGPTSPPPMTMSGEVLGANSIMITPFATHKPVWQDKCDEVSAAIGKANDSFVNAAKLAATLKGSLKNWNHQRKIENYAAVVSEFEKGCAIFKESRADLRQLRGSLEHLVSYYYNRPIATQDVHAVAKGLQFPPEEIVSQTQLLTKQRDICKTALKTLDVEVGRMLMEHDRVQVSILGLSQTVMGKKYQGEIQHYLGGFLASPSPDRLIATMENVTAKLKAEQTGICLKRQAVQKGKEKDPETMSDFMSILDVALYRTRQLSWLVVEAEFYKDQLTEKKRKKEENPVEAGQEIAVGTRLNKDKAEIEAEIKFGVESIAKKTTRIEEVGSHLKALQEAFDDCLVEVNMFRKKVEFKPKTLSTGEKISSYWSWDRKQDFAKEEIAPAKLAEVMDKLRELCESYRKTLGRYKVSAEKPDLSSQLVGPEYDAIAGEWFRGIDLEASKKNQT